MSPKGAYGRGDHPISEKYVVPRPRNPLLLAGLAAALVVSLLVWGAAVFLGSASFVAGPLSSAHASFANDCESCHMKGAAVADEKCAACHEEQADPVGIYSFASHYVYRSGDFRRVATHEGEQRCGTCHKEHRGREAPLTHVKDSECVGCHGKAGERGGVRHPAVTAFDRKHHPEFQAIGLQDDDNLQFSHDAHVGAVAKSEKLETSEQACLYCHNPRSGGDSFLPIDFDRHCAACHLKTAGSRPAPMTASLDAPVAAIMSPRDIRLHGGPGTGWTRAVSSLDFQEGSDGIRKSAVTHKDPWVLFNLRRLRNVLYPSGPLADLLEASPAVAPQDARILYDEAVQTLEAQAEELSGSPYPSLRKDLQRVQRELAGVRRRLRDPATSLSIQPFASDTLARRSLSPGAAAFDSVTTWLTSACQQCHRVEHAAIARVNGDQRSLLRARFDHRKHLVQRRCLDCHQRIPIRAVSDTSAAAPASKDMAAIQNLPAIETCVSCHASGKAGTACATCHDFHPKKTRPSEIPLAFE